MSHDELLAALQDASAGGVFHLPAHCREAVRRAAAEAGFACFEVSLADCSRLDEVLARLGIGLDFPDWYGHNLDALKDCLTDLSWVEAAGYVLAIDHAGPFLVREPEGFAELEEVLTAAVAEWRALGYPMWIFFDAQATGLAAFAETG
ncbi:barstar family protein [Accumulibacter sp.]|uniref:barstar family protein n=1 Tax=Accumulibacter sp. TaxID=2053492 RepID=UPI0025FE2A48|nr:barstar family protein [Accumulibacter sp.]MCM8611028.1 barstar family protein [Accumulibacter sp.]MCM8634848.1 barstar family protein [Accumulibacter sp.]MCM8638402.1 barstar family protein [Accumulibacter sp.]